MPDNDLRGARAKQRARMARVHRRRRLGALVVLVAICVAIASAFTFFTESGGSSASVASSPPSRSMAPASEASEKLRLRLRDVITSSALAPKSVVSSGTGYVFAQNMMYRHTVAVYDTTSLKLVKTIKDSVRLSKYGFAGKDAVVQGSPVEAAASPDHRFMYISQYSMFGDGFIHPGGDVCTPSSGIDNSFVYRVPLDSLKIDAVIKVGAVPKYLAVTPNGRYLLVANWCSYSLSVVSTASNKQVRSVKLGPYPRGIVVTPDSRTAYVAIMGGRDVAAVDLESFEVDWIKDVGSQPRHLLMSPDGASLYVSINAEGKIARINLATGKTKEVATGRAPRSMAMAPDGGSLYVVNYASNTLSKVRTKDMKVIQVVNTDPAPIGVTHDAPTRSIWVCCYGGSIMVFKEVAPQTAAPAT